MIVIRRVGLHVLEDDHWKITELAYLFFFSFFIHSRLSFSGESGTMSVDTPNLTTRRRSSTLVIPEGKPTFIQALEAELFINEDDQLT